MDDKKIIKDQVQSTDQERAQDQMFTMGHAQGVAFGAYQASHCSVDVEVLAKMTPSQAAQAMRELIVQTLKTAAEGDKKRAEAKA
jgi:hypothetical protein